MIDVMIAIFAGGFLGFVFGIFFTLHTLAIIVRRMRKEQEEEDADSN